jgi:hypothetical protein
VPEQAKTFMVGVEKSECAIIYKRFETLNFPHASQSRQATMLDCVSRAPTEA